MKYFVVGTDTGVGKTVFSLLLMRHFFDNGKKPFYIKPFQTGCRDPRSPQSDARFIYEHIPALRDHDPSESVVYCFNNPKAPYYAAKDDGKSIDFSKAAAFIMEMEKTGVPLVIEGAGGLMVPVDNQRSIIDLVKSADAQPVLVARAGLGTINHTRLSVEVLRHYECRKPVIVFMNDGAYDRQMILENMESIATHSGIPVSGVIDPIRNFHSPEPSVMATVSGIVDVLNTEASGH